MNQQRDFAQRKRAIVVIHGIGEQRPMQTLREFVEALLDDPDHPGTNEYWSKPDHYSDSFELRRYTVPESEDCQGTDFFELYWQHLMPGRRLSHVLKWIWSLLTRTPRQVPRQLLSLWYLSWTIIALAVVLVLVAPIKTDWTAILDLGILNPIIGILALIAQGFLLGYVADAARYLSPTPANVPCRQRLRSAGLSLLEKLHQSGWYNRIIVVGHSLGSVIGYDILYHSWAKVNNVHNKPEEFSQDALAKLERAIRKIEAGDDFDIDKFRDLQRDYRLELTKVGNPWLVTDFISLGSPLAHAELLLTDRGGDFSETLTRRECPACPPCLEEGVAISYPSSYTTADGSTKSISVPHHAACFGPTRWTNLYFPNKMVILGDVIGGALGEGSNDKALFGRGVRDIAVHTHTRSGIFNHTHYWKHHPKDSKQSGPLSQLREAIGLYDRKSWMRVLEKADLLHGKARRADEAAG